MATLLSHVCRLRTVLVALLGVCALLRPLPAQHAGRGESGLRARMTEFLRALPDDRGSDRTRRFFPSSGDLSYVRTVQLEDGNTRAERWVIPASETSSLFGYRAGVRVNPLAESLEISYEGQKPGLLLDVVMRSGDQWRLVGRNRFVPPWASASSPIFVEWRREGETWVISAFGDEWFYHLPPWY